MLNSKATRPGIRRLLKAETERLFLLTTLRANRGLESLRLQARTLATAASQSPYRTHLLELALMLGAYLVYLGSRGLVFPDLEAKGLENAQRIVSAEMWLGVFWEPAWQTWVLDRAEWLVLFFNGVYIFTYWPIIALVGLALYLFSRPKYYYYRTVVVINLVFALIIFAIFPLRRPSTWPSTSSIRPAIRSRPSALRSTEAPIWPIYTTPTRPCPASTSVGQ